MKVRLKVGLERFEELNGIITIHAEVVEQGKIGCNLADRPVREAGYQRNDLLIQRLVHGQPYTDKPGSANHPYRTFGTSASDKPGSSAEQTVEPDGQGGGGDQHHGAANDGEPEPVVRLVRHRVIDQARRRELHRQIHHQLIALEQGQGSQDMDTPRRRASILLNEMQDDKREG